MKVQYPSIINPYKGKHMGQVQLLDRQSSFIFYLVHQGKGRTEAARLAGLLPQDRVHLL